MTPANQASSRPTAREIIAISSHVVRGSVGNRAVVPALEILGFPVWAVPTITLPWHPGHGLATRIVPDDPGFSNLMTDLGHASWLKNVPAILSGYLASVEQVEAVAKLVENAKAKNSDTIYLCDPVIGDGAIDAGENGSPSGRLYIPSAIAERIRDRLLPLADITTPNAFELSWLSGMQVGQTPHSMIEAVEALNVETVLVTSVPGLMRNSIGNLLSQRGHATFAEHPVLGAVPNGTGDLTAALYLGNLLGGMEPVAALQKTTASVFEIITRSHKAGADELAIESEQISLTRPMAMVQMRDISNTVSRSTVQIKKQASSPLLIGVDGCKGGWVCVSRQAGALSTMPAVDVFPDVQEMLNGLLGDAPEKQDFILAVDMPMGLPETIEGPGRGPEQHIRQHLKKRQSSVFSIPSRSAVYAKTYPEACEHALATSTPPRKISKQAWHIFPKIIELDQFILSWQHNHGAPAPVYEVHPEMAFTALNGMEAMVTPKKIKSRVNLEGMAERKALLQRFGFAETFLDMKPPKRVAVDDFIDACSCLAVAERIFAGKARSYPEKYECDKKGIPIAIWA